MIAWKRTPSRSRLLPAAFAMIGLCAAVALGGGTATAQQEVPTEVLAATVRTHGFTCDQPLGAERDGATVNDQAVWILRCKSGTYRVRLTPNRNAQVEKLQ